MSDPKISAKGLAEFAFASATRKRSIARNYKFPSQGEGIGRAIYYAAALNAIRAYHKHNRDKGIFADAIQALELRVKEFEGRKKDRLKKIKAENNIRAIQIYAKQFGGKDFVLLPVPNVRLMSGRVVITAKPDLYVEHRGKQFLIKLDLGKKKSKSEVISALLYILYRAAIEAKLAVDTRRVLYFDTGDEAEYECPKDTPSRLRALEASCNDYAEIWSSLE